jgi:hypothetical protein
MPLTASARSELRRALKLVEDDWYIYLQEQMNAVYEGVKPGTTTLDQIAFLKGKADGAAFLWAELESWASEPSISGVPAEIDAD